VKLRGAERSEGSRAVAPQWPAISCGILLAGLAASGARARTTQKARTVVRASILGGLESMKGEQAEEGALAQAGAAEQSKGKVADNSDMDQFMDKDFDETDSWIG